MLYFVYALIDPRDALPFYVGITNNPNLRMLQHLSGEGGNDKKQARISDIQSLGLSPKMHIVEVTEGEKEVRTREIHWIHEYKQKGIPLTNIQHSKKKQKHIRAKSKLQKQVAKPATVKAKTNSKRSVLEQTLVEEKPRWNYEDTIAKTASEIVSGDQIYNGRRWRPLQVRQVEQRGARILISFIDEMGRDIASRYKPDYPFNVMTQPITL